MFLKLWALLLNCAGQIPSAETVNYDALFTTTLRNYRSKLSDNISRGNKWVSFLKEKGRFRKQSGGINAHVPLMHALTSAADICRGYGVIDTPPQDGMTTAFYEWSQLSTPITISNKEKKQNKGEAKIIDLLKAKTMQSEVSLKELLNNCLVAGRYSASSPSAEAQLLARVGRLDSGAAGPLPVGHIVDVDPTRSVSVGNINGGTYSFWRNQVAATAVTTFALLKRGLNNQYNNCSRGTGGAPDILLGDQVAWEIYWLSLDQKEQYIINSKRTVDILGGTDALAFRGATFYWDEVVGDPETPYNVVDAAGTQSKSAIYLLNTD